MVVSADLSAVETNAWAVLGMGADTSQAFAQLMTVLYASSKDGVLTAAERHTLALEILAMRAALDRLDVLVAGK